MTRFKAFAIHFAISFVIFLILLYFILVQWYPQPLFSTDGGWQIIRIVVGIDLVLGPVLTFVVFKKGKPGLKVDLSIIALLQAMALAWGIYIISNEHPAAIIYTVDRFNPVPSNQLSKLGITSKELKKYGRKRPILIFNNIPKEKEYQLLVESIKNQKPLYLFKEYYSKFSSSHIEKLKSDSMKLEKYTQDNPKLLPIYQRSLQNIPLKANVVFLPLHSRKKWVTAIFDLDKMKIIDTINLNPVYYKRWLEKRNYKRKTKKQK